LARASARSVRRYARTGEERAAELLGARFGAKRAALRAHRSRRSMPRYLDVFERDLSKRNYSPALFVRFHNKQIRFLSNRRECPN
jgi:hypothetical protein